MLNIQKFLLESNYDFALLKETTGIGAKFHSKFPNLVQLCYDQIESSKCKDHPMVRECRGIIIDTTNCAIVARPFDRFFNYGESAEEDAKFNWSSFTAQEKVDGSLMIMYNYDGEWQVATKGSPDAGGNVGQEQFTFADLFWKTLNKQIPNFLKDVATPGFTYMFELTSRYNRVVTSQIENEGTLTLIGCRRTFDGVNLPIDNYVAAYIGPQNVVKSFPMKTIEEIKTAAAQLDPSKQEGFVLVDNKFNRIKVKSEKYVLIHHLKDSINDERIVELIKTGEDSEVFAYFPDLKIRYDKIKKYWDMTAGMLDEIWLWDIQYSETIFETQKDFALHVQNSYNPLTHSFFYMMRSGKVKNATEWLMALRPEKVLDVTINLQEKSNVG